MRVITDVPKEELVGKYVLLRSGLNAPVENGVVTDDFRVRRALPTITYLKDAGAKVVVVAHIGREQEESLAPVAPLLRTAVGATFVPDLTGAEAHTAAGAMKNGDVLLLENLRSHPGEVGNDHAFAQELARFGELYVNDAFAVSHRAHASLVTLPQLLPCYSGLLLKDEIEHLSQALTPEAPSLAILGGAKFETKEPLIHKLLEVYDHVLIGGALANDIFLARGYEVGRSLVSEEHPDESVLNHRGMIAPVDVVAEREDGQARVVAAGAVSPNEKIVDVGPDTIRTLVPHIQSAKNILWNGPMGLYEGGYDEWTRALAHEIANSSAHSIVGGGDTLATIQNEQLEDKFNFISTGGGAMLEFLLAGTLPAVQLLAD